MKIIFHPTKKSKGGELYFDYFSTATGKAAPGGFQLRVSIEEDPCVRIYERVFVKGGTRV